MQFWLRLRPAMDSETRSNQFFHSIFIFHLYVEQLKSWIGIFHINSEWNPLTFNIQNGKEDAEDGQ